MTTQPTQEPTHSDIITKLDKIGYELKKASWVTPAAFSGSFVVAGLLAMTPLASKISYGAWLLGIGIVGFICCYYMSSRIRI